MILLHCQIIMLLIQMEEYFLGIKISFEFSLRHIRECLS